MNMDAEAVSALEPEDRWYVVHCRPLKEEYAAKALRDIMGLATYSPQVMRRTNSRTQSAAFFPGYIFVQADLREVKLSSINSTPGVLKLLYLGGVPQWLPVAVVEAIRERVDTLNADGGLPRYTFHPGDPVLLRDGPLRGLQAVFIGPMTPRARVKVLLEFLGRPNEVQVDLDVLEPLRDEPLRDNPAPRPARTTRGRGRRIRV
jgi:transcriptional antiterminator RfaH